MTTSFPLFTSFPREIQELIWDAAVRPVPSSPHIQRCIIADHYFNQANPRYPVLGDFVRFGRQDGPRSGFSLAIPWHDPNGNTNESVYALDSGLWSACTASRSAMERRFKKNEWWSDLPHQEYSAGFTKKGAFAGQHDVFHSALYINREGETRYITINTEDLIYLDPRHLDSVDWFHHYAGDFLPLIDYRGEDSAATNSSFLGLNIAIDFDPRMMDTLAGRSAHYCRGDLGLFSMTIVDIVDVLHESAGRTLWFVDHRLRPRSTDSTAGSYPEESEAGMPPSTLSSDTKRQIFHAEGYELVEVRREDMELWAIDATDNKSSSGACSVFDFFDLLFRKANGTLDIENSPRMRALACQTTSNKDPRRRGPYENTRNPSCPVCYPKEEIRRVRPVMAFTDVHVDDDISLSDLNLFD
ncbi:hypothetical protein ACHAPT_002173 [Fusarium lateritium]